MVPFKEKCGREKSIGEQRETMDESKMLINILRDWIFGRNLGKGVKKNAGETGTCECFE